MACKDCFVILCSIFLKNLLRFRWVFCQLETLRHCLPPSVRGILAELPETLDETYERILREIPKTNRVHAHRLLQCLAVAICPLRVEELAEVLAIDFDAEGGIPKLNEGFRWSDQEQAVLSACSSLVAIVEDQGSRRVQFSHFSVKEFLTSDRLVTSAVDVLRGHHIRLESAHTIMAQACLGVLLRLNHHMDKGTIMSYPLAKYAGGWFVDHAKFEDVLLHISDGLDDLLDPDKPHFDTWLWLRYGDWNRNNEAFIWSPGSEYLIESLPDQSNSEHPTPIFPPQIFPLYYAVALGYTCLAQHLILKRPRDVDASDRYGTTALHVAAYWQNRKVAQMLVERTAAIDIRDKNGRTPLHYAMHDVGSDCDYDEQECDAFHCVRLLLDSGASAEAQNNDGSTPLHVAVASKMSQEIVQLLIQNSTNIHLQNNKGQTVVHEASRYGPPDILQLILNHNADVDALDNDCSSPLHLAIPKGSPEAAHLLLKHGASVHLRNHMGQTALHKASQRGHLDIVRLILDHGADLNLQDNYGFTPLHLATYLWSTEVVQLLLQHGADVTLRNDKGQSALHQASQRGYVDIIQLILNYDADVDALDNDGSTPLHLAISEASLEAVQLLLKHGSNINIRNYMGQTALHRASQRGHLDIIQLILHHGADVDTVDNDGSTPLHLAIPEVGLESFDVSLGSSEGSSEGSPGSSDVNLIANAFDFGASEIAEASLEAVRLLLEHGANVDLPNHMGQTVLHIASRYGDLGIIKRLLDHNANVDALDLDGSTPLHLAISEAHLETVRILLDHGASVDMQNNQGETLFQAATTRGLQEITELLSMHFQREQRV